MFTLAVDNEMAEMFYPFSPFFNLLVLDEPLKISRNCSMTDSVIGSASEWISRQKRQYANFAA